MEGELVHIECSPAELTFIIQTAALYAEDNDPHREMYLRVTEDGVETPASTRGANQTSFCSLSGARFSEFSVSEPISVLFSIPTVLEWISWFGDEQTISVDIIGEEGAELGDQLRLSGESQSVTIDCLSDPVVLEDIEFWLPERFTEDGQFTDETGEPVPTRIETTAETLQRLVDAAEQCTGAEQYPLRTVDGTLRLDIDGEESSLSGTLPSSVEGPPVDNWYGPGFARVIRGIEGAVTLQTGPEMDVAIVAERPDARLRYFTAVIE